MPQFLGRLIFGVVLSVLVSAPVVVAGASTATATGTVTETAVCPPAIIQSFRANNVVPENHTYAPQRYRLNANNPCNGHGCPQDEPSCVPTFTYMTVTGQRTAGSGASCRFSRESEPNSELQDGGLSYTDTRWWTINDAVAKGAWAPRLSNACAGAWDVTVKIRNENYDGTVTSTSAPYRQSRSFIVRRPSRLTTNAGPDPRVGSTATIKGRLTRTDWNQATNPQVGYPGQRVFLKRATSEWGIYHTLKTVRTDRNGYLRTGVKALSGTRCYRWVFHTRTTTQRGVSAADCTTTR